MGSRLLPAKGEFNLFMHVVDEEKRCRQPLEPMIFRAKNSEEPIPMIQNTLPPYAKHDTLVIHGETRRLSLISPSKLLCTIYGEQINLFLRIIGTLYTINAK